MSGFPVVCRSAVLLILVALTSCAPRPLVRPVVNPDRPSYSDGVGIVTPGMSLLTIGYSDSRSQHMRVQSIGEGLLRVGMHPRVELRIQPNSWLLQRNGSALAAGLQDARVGVKAAVYVPAVSGWRPAASMVVTTSLPNGGRAIGADAPMQPEAKLVLTSQPHPRFGVTANAAYQHAVMGERRAGYRYATMLASFSLTDRLGVYAELLRTAAPGDFRRYHDAGVTARITNDLQVDAWLGNRAGVRERAAGFGLAIQR